MANFVSEPNVSAAWTAGLAALVDNGGDAVNLAVTIADPTAEAVGVRRALDAFVQERRRAGREIERVSTVANTLFPAAWYIERLGLDAEKHLYELERTARPVSRRRNPRGTYFERMVAWPGKDGAVFNQLDQVIRRLRSARALGHHRGNAYEVGVAMPEDEIAVPVMVAGKDRNPFGFPCLSHLSFSLHDGVVHLSAIYRSHNFISRAYGNYLGLGRVLRFVGRQSGLPIGELTCLSASATAEVGRGGSFGMERVENLLAQCREALKVKVTP